MAITLDGTNGIDSPDFNMSGVGVTYPLVSGTAIASTSGTSIEFTGIPSWAKRITIIFQGVSTNGTNVIQVQLGSTTYTVTGYISTNIAVSGTTAGSGNSTTGFNIINSTAALAANVASGMMVITNITSNTWVQQFSMGFSTVLGTTGGGYVSLSGVLDRVRIIGGTTGTPTDTFDAGSINIMYE